jgi:hypothetical protein
VLPWLSFTASRLLFPHVIHETDKFQPLRRSVINMTTYPEMSVQDRTEQPYVGLTATIAMDDFSAVADRLPEIFRRLAERGVQPAGPPFFRYKVIDMEREMVVEAGVPVAEPLIVDGLEADVLPPGRHVTTTFTGHPKQLMSVTADLLRWADDQGLAFDQHAGPLGDVWGCRLEFYETDPAVEPDMNHWTTTLAFRLAG